MPKSPLCALSATDIATQTNTGTLRCEEVARACLARIEAREPIVKAWSFLDYDLVLRQAKALDAIAYYSPLRGVPVGVKDVIETCDMPTEMGSPIYRGYRAKSDASCVALLRAAGALIFRKTVTCEFAGVTAGKRQIRMIRRVRRAVYRAAPALPLPISWYRSELPRRPVAQFNGPLLIVALSVISRASVFLTRKV